MSNISYTNNRRLFIEGALSLAISEAAGWVDHLEYNADDETVTIVCNNGHCYCANIACDSKIAIITDVMKVINAHS